MWCKGSSITRSRFNRGGGGSNQDHPSDTECRWRRALPKPPLPPCTKVIIFMPVTPFICREQTPIPASHVDGYPDAPIFKVICQQSISQWNELAGGERRLKPFLVQFWSCKSSVVTGTSSDAWVCLMPLIPGVRQSTE